MRKTKNNVMGSVRIVGGSWRGRRVPVLERPGLRPTGDRQRETLFNWLQGEVQAARVLDLFAGSGALGLEALSRGAAHADFVEVDGAAARQLGANIEMLGARACVHRRDWRAFLSAAETRYNLVFLDPPFAEGWLPEVIDAVDGLLDPRSAWVYMEHAADQSVTHWPDRWQLYREGGSGGAVGRLFQIVSRDTC